MIYTIIRRLIYMETAKIFENGRSQAVRIPKQYRLPEGEVLVQRIGNSLVLTPKDKAAENFIESLSEFTDDFMSEGRINNVTDKRDEL